MPKTTYLDNHPKFLYFLCILVFGLCLISVLLMFFFAEELKAWLLPLVLSVFIVFLGTEYLLLRKREKEFLKRVFGVDLNNRPGPRSRG